MNLVKVIDKKQQELKTQLLKVKAMHSTATSLMRFGLCLT